MEKKELLQLEQMEHILRIVWTKYHEYIMPKTIDLSAQQLYFLRYVQTKHPCTPSDISKAFGITLGAITGFLDRLCKLGLVTRSRTEADRRLVLIELTPKGTEILNHFEQQKLQKFSVLLEQFGSSEVQMLNDLLKKFETSLDKIL